MQGTGDAAAQPAFSSSSGLLQVLLLLHASVSPPTSSTEMRLLGAEGSMQDSGPCLGSVKGLPGRRLGGAWCNAAQICRERGRRPWEGCRSHGAGSSWLWPGRGWLRCPDAAIDRFPS